MSQLAIGIIETIGLAAAIEAADVCLKSANVSLIGYELTRGNGMTVVKIEGNVGAVKAAIEAASVAVNKVSKVYSQKVIPRPSDSIEFLVRNENTVGYENLNIISDEVEEIEEEKHITNIEDVIKEDINKEKESIENEIEIEAEAKISQNDESILEDDKEEVESESDYIELKDDSNLENSYTCNLCKDPKCPRVKGDLRSECIHYDEKKEK